MKTNIRFIGLMVLAAALIASAGCSRAGRLGDILGGVLGGGRGGDIVAEVQYVDTRDREIRVRTRRGRRLRVAYDRRTRVVYNGREYPVRALERGDIVSLRIRETRYGLYTDYIRVERSVQERRRGGDYGDDDDYYGDYRRLEGEVGDIGRREGRFELRVDYGEEVIVFLPYGVSDYTVDRFRRLDRGDYVRIEGEFVGDNRFRLERFAR